MRRNTDEIRDAFDTLGQRSSQKFRDRQGDQSRGVQDREAAVRDKDGELAAIADRPDGGGGQSNAPTSTGDSPSVIIDERKFDYLFGLVRSNRHNQDRSQGMFNLLRDLGLPDTRGSRDYVRAHLLGVALDDSSIMRTIAGDHGLMQIRDSLFAAPGGFVRFESTWQSMSGGALRFVTVVMLRGA